MKAPKNNLRDSLSNSEEFMRKFPPENKSPHPVKAGQKGEQFRKTLEESYSLCSHGLGENLRNIIDSDDPKSYSRLMDYCLDSPDYTALHYAVLKNSLNFIRVLLELEPAMITKRDIFGATPLHIAVGCNNFVVVKTLLQYNTACCSMEDLKGNTPWHVAVESEFVDIVKALLEKNDEPVDSNGLIPFYLALRTGNKEMVREFLTYPRHLRGSRYTSLNPLHLASKFGTTPPVAQLLISTLKLDIDDAEEIDGATALHFACKFGHRDLVKFLIDNDAGLLPDKVGTTPLHLAVRKHHIDTVKDLTERYPASINSVADNGLTPLHEAALNNDVDIAQLLIEKRADIDRTDREGITSPRDIRIHHEATPPRNLSITRGMTPLAWSVSRNNKEVARLLLEKNARTDISDIPLFSLAILTQSDEMTDILLRAQAPFCIDELGNNALHLASGCTEIVRRFLEVDSDTLEVDSDTLIDQTNSDGSTALHLASMEGHVEVVRLLCTDKRFTCSYKKDNAGERALHSASRAGHVAVVRLLLDKGMRADDAETVLDLTPVHLAALRGHEEVVKVLLERSDKLTNFTQDTEGRTALHLAVLSGNTAIAEILINFRLKWDPEVEVFKSTTADNKGNTPLHLATLKKDLEMVRTLLPTSDKQLRNNEGQTAYEIAINLRNPDLVKLFDN